VLYDGDNNTAHAPNRASLVAIDVLGRLPECRAEEAFLHKEQLLLLCGPQQPPPGVQQRAAAPCPSITRIGFALGRGGGPERQGPAGEAAGLAVGLRVFSSATISRTAAASSGVMSAP
jgi:hypothetical protein